METNNPKKIVEELRSNIQKITQNINQIEGLLQQLGTPKDSNELRKKISTIQLSTKEILGASQKKIKELHNYSLTHSGELKLVKERLTDELIKIVGRFQTVAKLSVDKQKAFEVIEKTNTTAVFTKNEFESYDSLNSFAPQNLYQQQQKQASQNDQLHIVVERQQKFQQLESDIVDLNSMFKDLAVMVHDQGEVIDNIENNIQNTVDTVETTNVELKGAIKYQSKARRKKICIIITIIIALIALILIVTLSLQPWKK